MQISALFLYELLWQDGKEVVFSSQLLQWNTEKLRWQLWLLNQDQLCTNYYTRKVKHYFLIIIKKWDQLYKLAFNLLIAIRATEPDQLCTNYYHKSKTYFLIIIMKWD